MLETTKADEAAQVAVATDYPRLLFVNDLPPCHLTAGPMLMRQMLAEYPMDRLTVACGAGRLPRAAKTLLPCRHVPLFKTTSIGRWGLGRIRQFFDVAALGPNVLALERLLRETRSEAVLTVAHDIMFIAAVLAANRAGKPAVLVVHDDWTWHSRTHPWLPRALLPVIFGRILRRASHIYAISEGVREWLHDDFGVDSELQLPGVEPTTALPTNVREEGGLRIVTAGALLPSSVAGMNLLLGALRAGVVGENWTLDVYGGASPAHISKYGWEDRRVTGHGWRPSEEVQAAMAQADLLYAPYGFDAESRRLAVRSFPYKVACYFAARKPVLVCAAPESSIARYARQWDCVELAEEPTVEAVGAALRRVAGSPERQRRLVEHGLQAFAANHDIHRQRADLVRLLRHLTRGQSATT